MANLSEPQLHRAAYRIAARELQHLFDSGQIDVEEMSDGDGEDQSTFEEKFQRVIDGLARKAGIE